MSYRGRFHWAYRQRRGRRPDYFFRRGGKIVPGHFPKRPRRIIWIRDTHETDVYPKTKAISKAVGAEEAEEEIIHIVTDDQNDVRAIVKTYKWPHDGPWNKVDYEPVIWFYKKGFNRPSHAISFSHYGYVYHIGLRSWDRNDFSPRFPNEFHTPVLRANRTRIVDGTLSRGAYAYAIASLHTREQKPVETSQVREGFPPNSVEISKELTNIIQNWEECWIELQKG